MRIYIICSYCGQFSRILLVTLDIAVAQAHARDVFEHVLH